MITSTITCISLVLIFRSFQLWLAQAKNRSQWGSQAIFNNDQLAEFGITWVLNDLRSMLLASFFGVILITFIFTGVPLILIKRRPVNTQ